MPEHDRDERHEIERTFNDLVNMSPSEHRSWLETEDSRSVGMTHEGERVTHDGEKEAVGHAMGGRVLAVRAKKVSERDDDDYDAMRKVIGYVHRHMKQRPTGDVTDTRWRKSLMNWGHDPLKD